jgi:hypothetical protein
MLFFTTVNTGGGGGGSANIGLTSKIFCLTYNQDGSKLKTAACSEGTFVLNFLKIG